jgi:hypothetical protein
MKNIDIPFKLIVEITRTHNIVFDENDNELNENEYIIIKKNNYLTILNLLQKNGFNEKDDLFNQVQTNIEGIISLINLIMQNSFETAEQIFILSQVKDVKIKVNLPSDFVNDLISALKKRNKFFRIFKIIKKPKHGC